MAITLSTLGCGELDLVFAVCEWECYTGPEQTKNVGECRPGTWSCEDGDPVECIGEVLPGPELCDGRKDESCDGETDEGCDLQELACLHPSPEVCNSIDDDCSGIVDDLPVGPLCYDGDPETLAYGPCRAGVMACVDGRWICAYQVLPMTEVCDGREIDDDCDGRVDNIDEAVDVTFVIDVSGSMFYEEIPWIRSILARVAELLEEDRFRLAVVLSPLLGSRPPRSMVAQDFLNPEAFLSEGVAEMVTGHSGASEPLYDAMHDLATGTTLQLSWRECATRWQVVFTDVHPYEKLSFRDPLLEEEDVAIAIEEAGHRVLVVHSETSSIQLAPFDSIVRAGRGRFLHLSDDVEELAQAISEEVSRCVP